MEENIQKFFNLYQADIFINKGATCKGCGMESKKAYILLEKNEIYYDLLDKWNNRTLIK